MRKTRKLLIDGDVIVYQQALAAEVPIHWGGDLWTLHADFAEVKSRVDEFIDSAMEKLEADDLVVAISVPTDEGFRRKLNPSYKSNRASKRKPVCYAALRDYLESDYEAYKVPGIEADDALGILATYPKEDEERIIVSVDKDFKGVPCQYYNFQEDQGIASIPQEDADYFHALQTLAGDSTDGYSGCPGIGMKSAEKVLDGLPKSQWWDAIVATYEKKGLGKDAALLTARMARILQWEDLDQTTKKVKLWTPKKWQQK